MTEATFYPDADPETTSVDGDVWQSGANYTWAEVRDGVGNSAVDNATKTYISIQNDNAVNPNKWQGLSRVVLLFDTSPLPDGATIVSAVLSVYGTATSLGDPYGWLPALNIYAPSPTLNTALANADYNVGNWGSTALSDNLVAASWNNAGWNNWTLNATGLALISKTSITKLGIREVNYDVANVEHTPWVQSEYVEFSFYTAEQGTIYRPKLVVTYTTDSGGGGSFGGGGGGGVGGGGFGGFPPGGGSPPGGGGGFPPSGGVPPGGGYFGEGAIGIIGLSRGGIRRKKKRKGI